VLAHLGDNPDQVLERIALTAQYSNLYLDICGNGFERMGILEHAIKTAGEDRVLFGSDFTINDPSGVIARIRNSYLSDSVQEKIFSKNLARLLADRGVPV
jgi:predicted TIM-barrel fold metal-dependent hydrolase